MKEEKIKPLSEGDIKGLDVLVEDQMFPDVLVLEPGGRSFIWEYAHEKCSRHPTQFWEIWPDEQ